MSKTFEALMKAKDEQRISAEDLRPFYLQPRRRGRLRVSAKPMPDIAEEYQRMKHGLVSAASGERVKAVMFVSSNEGEGTTTTVVNFAVHLCAESHSVLLVDANLRSPAFHESFGLERAGGLSDMLNDRKNLLDVIVESKIRNLSVIPAGTAFATPAVLFESKNLDAAISQMKRSFDWILFDAPPVNLYNDAALLAPHVDGVILVVEAERTRREVVMRAKGLLQQRGTVRLLGAVFNHRKLHIPDWAYKLL